MRRLAWFSGGFGLACLLSCYLSQPLWLSIPAGILCLLCLALFLISHPKHGEEPDPYFLPKKRKYLFFIARRGLALTLGCTLAFLWFSGYAALFRAPAQSLAGREQTISGTVSSYPRETSIGGYSMTLRLDGGITAPDVLMYGSRDWGSLVPGDRVTCEARLKTSTLLRGDETTYYTAKGVFLLGYCNEKPAVEKADHIPLRHWPAHCAHALKGGIYAAFDETAAPLAAAVTLGDKKALDEQLYSALNRAGVMHAAVVSGMHISFLVAVLLVLCRGRRGVALCLLPLLFFYALMAGGTPSALRAVIMQAVLLAGPVLRRESDPPTSLGLALLLLLLQNPFAAASVSLQLSFASVAGILMVTSPIYTGLWSPVKKRIRGDGLLKRSVRALCRFFFASVSVSLGAMVLTTPLIAFYFGQVTLLAPFTNLLVLWAVSILMVSALFIGTLAIFLPGFMALPGALFSLAGHYICRVVSAVGGSRFAALDSRNPYVLIWLAAVYLLLGTIVLSRRRWRQAGISTACILALLAGVFVLNTLSVRSCDLTIHVLDVGQGSCALFLSGSRSMLVDCGGRGRDSAGDLAADKLAALGRTHLDTLIFTHLDDDHFNGTRQLFSRLEVDEVILPELPSQPEKVDQLLAMAREEGAEVSFLTTAEVFSFGTSTVTLYPPLGHGAPNEEGLFVLTTCGDFDALITGDTGSFVEKMLIKYYDLPDIELLFAGHHGSANSTCSELLEAVTPELAVISVGYNTYGHPADEALLRLSQAGVRIYRTDQSGTITFSLLGDKLSVQ